MIYLLLGPFGLFLFYRVLFPIFWCFDFLFSESLDHEYYNVVIIHALYLFFEAFLVMCLMFYIINKTNKYRIFRGDKGYFYEKNKQGRKYAIYSSFIIFIILYLNFNSLPILLDGGSDAIVALGEVAKNETWFVYGILSVFSSILLISTIYIDSKLIRFIYFIILFIAFSVTGKKSAIIILLNNFIFLYYVMNYKKPSLPVIRILLFIFISSGFIVLQLYRTQPFDFKLVNVPIVLYDLIYSSSTSYLSQFIHMRGLEFAQMYSDGLGENALVTYVFNSFTKFLFGTGIEKSIGPYLMFKFYGTDFPYGVNPTIFFETIFVFGDFFAVILSFILIFIVFLLAGVFFKKTVDNFNKNILLTVTYFGLFITMFGITSDILGNIRILPFILLPMFIYYFIRFFINSGRR